MNAGFSSLTALKAQLLASSLRTRNDWDTKLTALGLGVAGAIGGYCNRTFARAVATNYVTTGRRASLVLPRYPIEAISALDVRDNVAEDWVSALELLDTYNPESGCVYFDGPLDYAQIRVIYTGGFWWNISEDPETPDVLPEGATQIPDDVVTAWHLQCEALWRAHDKLGTKIAKDAEPTGGALTSADLSPAVRQMLTDHIRYSLT